MRLRAIMLAAVMLLCAAPAFSQSCAMCYGSAKSTSKEGQKAINKGVIVLFIPPFAFLTLGFWMAIRYGRQRDLEQSLSLGLVAASREGGLRSESSYKLSLLKGI
jgi:hypothetical protein